MTFFLLIIASVLIIFSIYYHVKDRKQVSTLEANLKSLQEKEHGLQKELNSLQKKLHAAIQDPVTHLIGWQLFEDRLSQSIKEGERYQLNMGILIVDINNFKIINEALGYTTGDMVLREVANRLQSCVRQVDSFSRHSKDTFIVLLQQLNKPESAALIAQRMLQAIAAPLQVENQELYLSACIGISIYPTDGNQTVDLLRHAGQALRIAKKTGKQTYQFYREEANESSQRELKLVTALRRETIFEEFTLYYQPIINTQQETIFCMDALLQWQHPELGSVRSEELFHYAEREKKTNEVTEWILAHACKQFLHWRTIGFSPEYLAIPISIKQLENTQFIYRISQILQELSFDPAGLILEIKENETQISLDILEKSFNMLHYLNIKLAVDHFGSSAFSLRHLKNFSVHYLKLDPLFIDDISENQNTKALVKSMVTLATNMSAQLIIQGVESHEQVELLKETGCNLLQGIGLQAPLSEQEVVRKMGISLQE